MANLGVADDEFMNTQNSTPLGIFLRLLAATAVMFAAALSPIIFSILPYQREINRGELFGGGSLGLLVSCAIMVIVCCVVTAVAYVLVRLLTTKWDRNPVSVLGLQLERRGLTWCLAMVATAFIIAATGTIVLQLIGVRGDPVELSGDTWWAKIILMFAVGVLMQGMPEEIIWRGWLMSSISDPRKAAFLSVTVFALLHLVSGGGQENLLEHFIYLAAPFGLAFAAAMTRLATHSTWPAIGIHGGFHLANLLALFMPVESGPERWLFDGVAWVCVGLFIAWRCNIFHQLDAHRQHSAIDCTPVNVR